MGGFVNGKNILSALGLRSSEHKALFRLPLS